MNIIFLILTWIIVIYVDFSLWAALAFLIWIAVYWLSSFLNQIEPSRDMSNIRILSIFMIFFILYYNSSDSNILMSVIPLYILILVVQFYISLLNKTW